MHSIAKTLGLVAGLALCGLPALHAQQQPKPEQQQPDIEFKVLLIIKQITDAYSPLFLPVRSQMSEQEIASARRCFEVETPDMVREITRGKVRFTPKVYISKLPLHVWNPKRRDSAEILEQELLNEFYTSARPGEYDSVGYYFLHRDKASGYQIPRAGYGVGWFDKKRSVGLFAVNATEMNPRDEIFLHEWIHGLDGFYAEKKGVNLPKGWLHGIPNYPTYQERIFRPGDTFKGWMDWYRDYLNKEIRGDKGPAGLGSIAWTYGPMRNEALKLTENYRGVPLQVPAYPEWIYSLMRGDFTKAQLGDSVLVQTPPTEPTGTLPWKLKTWRDDRGTTASVVQNSSGALQIESSSPNNAALSRAVALQPFKNYLFSAEVKTESVEITEKGGRFGASLSAQGSVSTAVLTGTSEWIAISIPFTTGEKASEVMLRLSLGGTGSVAKGRALFRNVQLRAIGYPSTESTP